MASDSDDHDCGGTKKRDPRRKELLEDWTHRKITGFCYPNGNFDGDVIQELREAGHEYACTTLPGRNDVGADRFQLRRIDMTVDRVTDASGGFDPLGFRAEICMMREALRKGTVLPAGSAE